MSLSDTRFIQLYRNGDVRYPTMVAAVDSQKRGWYYTQKDNKVALGKLWQREPKDKEGSAALAARCRKSSGVSSISWYWFGCDVIEVDLEDIEHIDKVLEAYRAEGYPIQTVNY